MHTRKDRPERAHDEPRQRHRRPVPNAPSSSPCSGCSRRCAGRICSFAWAAWRRSGAGNGSHVRVGPYHAADLARLLFALWIVVIAAMMLPAAAPSVLLYARVKARRERWVYPGTFLFMLGYLFVWTCCALAAALADWHPARRGRARRDDGHRAPDGRRAGAGRGRGLPVDAGQARLPGQLPRAAGLCPDPVAAGDWGAFRMGVTDASYCTGCCWLLLALVLPAGVLNLPVICGLIALILAEKLLPGGHVLACATGLGLVGLGTALLFP
jgi:hypothetical protein